MGQSKEYFLKLREQEYQELSNDEKIYLNRLGMITKHIPSEEDEKEDERVKEFNKAIKKAYEERDKYLFNKRNK